MKEFPEDPYIVEPLAKAYFELGDKAKSKSLYEIVVQIYERKGDAVKVERIKHDMAMMFPEGM